MPHVRFPRLRMSAIAVLFLNACAGTGFQPTLPVESRGGFFNPDYRQGESPLSSATLLRGLKEQPGTHSRATRAERWGYGSAVLSGVGAYFVTYAIVNSRGRPATRRAQVAAGLVSLAAGAGAASLADRRLKEAIELHNGTLAVRKGASFYRWLPSFDVIEANEKRTVLAGICGFF